MAACRGGARARPSRGRGGARRSATFGGVPHRLEDVAEARGVTCVNDSKATNVASARVRHRGVRRRRPPDRRRQPQGRRLRGAARRGRRALPGRLPDRRGQRPAGRRPRPTASRSRAAATSSTPSPRPARRPSRATSCCCRRRARASTSTRTSRRAASTSARWRSGGRRGMNSRGRVEEMPDGAQPPAHEAPARVLADLHGDALPARARRGDGLLGELRGVAARRAGDPSYYLKRYVGLAVVGLVVLHLISRHGLRLVKAAHPGAAARRRSR